MKCFCEKCSLKDDSKITHELERLENVASIFQSELKNLQKDFINSFCI